MAKKREDDKPQQPVVEIQVVNGKFVVIAQGATLDELRLALDKALWRNEIQAERVTRH